MDKYVSIALILHYYEKSKVSYHIKSLATMLLNVYTKPNFRQKKTKTKPELVKEQICKVV